MSSVFRIWVHLPVLRSSTAECGFSSVVRVFLNRLVPAKAILVSDGSGVAQLEWPDEKCKKLGLGLGDALQNVVAQIAGMMNRLFARDQRHCTSTVTRGAGKNLVAFPEGSRARSGRLQPFSRLSFDLALAANVPVLPAVVHSTKPLMGKAPGSAFPRRKIFCRVRFLHPELPRKDGAAARLCDRVHRRIALELKQLDAGASWGIKSATP